MKYKKTSGKRELLNPIQLGQTQATPKFYGQPADAEEIELAYIKDEAAVDARLFFLLVEGESKEMEYFRCLQDKNKYNNLCVISVPMSNSREFEGNLVTKISSSLGKAQQTGSITHQSRSIRISDIDSVYVVIDVDDLYEQIKVEKGKWNMAKWIVSNPCFEIWLYYAYHSTPQVDFTLEDLDIQKRSKALKAQLNTIHKGGIGCRDAFAKIKDACANSTRNYAEDDTGMPTLYSTSMHILALDIYNVIESEHKERLRLRQEQIARFYRANK